jgi:hypothetical protein
LPVDLPLVPLVATERVVDLVVDLAVVDLATPGRAAVDLAAVDLAVGPLATVDLAPAVDLAVAVDLADAVDLAIDADFVDFGCALLDLAPVCLVVVCAGARTASAPQPAANTAADTEIAKARKHSV